jgi:hypothetical protein
VRTRASSDRTRARGTDTHTSEEASTHEGARREHAPTRDQHANVHQLTIISIALCLSASSCWWRPHYSLSRWSGGSLCDWWCPSAAAATTGASTADRLLHLFLGAACIALRIDCLLHHPARLAACATTPTASSASTTLTSAVDASASTRTTSDSGSSVKRLR